MALTDNKTYTYKGNDYLLKPITLGVLKHAAPLMARLRKLQHEYTRDIDLSEINSARQRIDELETAISQLEDERKSTGINEQEKNEQAKRIDVLKETLSNEETAFSRNAEFQSTLKLYNECLALAALEAISDTELVNKFIESAVKPVGQASGKVNVDSDDSDSVDFVKEVLVDFFYLIAGKKPAQKD